MSKKIGFTAALGVSLLFLVGSGTAQNPPAQTPLSQGATTFSATNSTQVVNVTQTGTGYGIKASTTSTSPVGAIFGQATGTTGFNNGVWGRTSSSAGVAVRGEAMSSTGGPTGVAGFSDFSRTGIGVYGHAMYNGFGVFGQIDSLDFSGAGVFGKSGVSCCGIPGLFEQDATSTGAYDVIIAGQYLDTSNQIQMVFTVDSRTVTGPRFLANPDPFGDDLFIGRAASNLSNVFRVDPIGNVYADGAYHTGGADFAEAFSVKGAASAYAPGDVLAIDQSSTRRLTRSSRPYSTLVAGIYSTKPGVLASPYAMDQAPKSDIPLAVMGVVPCKATTANGAISPGDLLVTSRKEGYAMKGTDKNRMVGAVLGKALEPLSRGDGIIQVLVTLQ